MAAAELANLETALTPRSGAAVLRARGLFLAISDALTQHPSYFDAGAWVRFAEVNLFGVYVAPISGIMVAANVLCANPYDHFGSFTVCVIAITVVYALILPVLLLAPSRLDGHADGQIPEVAFTADQERSS